MKKTFVSLLFAGICLFLLFPTAALANDPSATVFEEINLAGNRLNLLTGSYEEEYLNPKDSYDFRKVIKNYEGLYVKNDSISSVAIPLGFRVILTENNDYKGRILSIENRINSQTETILNQVQDSKYDVDYRTVEASRVLKLNNYSMDDKTSSIIVEEIKYDPAGPIVYEDSEFRKPSHQLGLGDYRKKQLPFGNDKISGIRVPKGYTVKMWDDDNYKDRNYTYVGPTTIPFLEGFNDKVSSMKIRLTGQSF